MSKDFVASNGFRVREEPDGGLSIDNLYIGPEYLLALSEAVIASEGSEVDTDEGPVIYGFIAGLEELDEGAAEFIWANFEPGAEDLLVSVPRAVWEDQGRPGTLHIHLHGDPGAEVQSRVVFTERAE